MGEQKSNVTQGSTSEVNYITTVLTKIIEGLDALEMTPDGESLNLWRRQCAWALGLLGALKARRIKELTEDIEDEKEEGLEKPSDMTEELSKRALKDPLLKEIDKLLAEWEPNSDGRIRMTSFENTTIEALDAADQGDRRVRMYFDSYEVNCFAEQTEVHLSHMEREKHNRICDRLSNWFGRAWKVIMQAGVIKLEQEIVSPVAKGYGSKASKKHLDGTSYKIKV